MICKNAINLVLSLENKFRDTFLKFNFKNMFIEIK